MWVESCENIPEEIQNDTIEECNRMDEALMEVNSSVTYTLDNNWNTWNENDLIIQLKNHQNNAWSRIAVPKEHLSRLNNRILLLIQNPNYPYSNDDNQTIFSQTTHHDVVEKLAHVWLISE